MYHHWGCNCTSIYRRLSYSFRTLVVLCKFWGKEGIFRGWSVWFGLTPPPPLPFMHAPGLHGTLIREGVVFVIFDFLWTHSIADIIAGGGISFLKYYKVELCLSVSLSICLKHKILLTAAEPTKLCITWNILIGSVVFLIQFSSGTRTHEKTSPTTSYPLINLLFLL